MADPNAANAQRGYDRCAETYDRQLAPFCLAPERIRQDTIARLARRPGATVIHAGCATGGSFVGLVTAVGPGAKGNGRAIPRPNA
jgi:ubiquinone/menaquinone biosynthesis C-methylase UbiE